MCHHGRLIFVFLIETGFHDVGQAGLELLRSSDPPTLAHQSVGITGCTYISINQVPRTHAIMISRPAWLWGAEMGANEHGVCIANEAISTREPAAETEALLGMDLVRLGLERGETAKEALDVIVSLLEEHGQGGNYYEDADSCHSFQSAYLIVDRDEAWVLETVGKYWAAEKVTEGVRCICNRLSLTTKMDAEHPELRSYAQSQGWWTGEDEFNFSEVFSPAEDHLGCCAGKDSLEKQEESITVQTMMNTLRDKASGVCIDSESFLTTASGVSVLPQNRSSPCIHYFTGTPDPSRQSRSVAQAGVLWYDLGYCKFRLPGLISSLPQPPKWSLTLCPGWSAVVGSQLTATSTFRVQLCFTSKSSMGHSGAPHARDEVGPVLVRSIFKPFIFVDDVKLVPKTQSPCFGDDDPAKKEPRFQEKPDRRHELYKAHEWARTVIESDQVSLHEGPGSRGHSHRGKPAQGRGQHPRQGEWCSTVQGRGKGFARRLKMGARQPSAEEEDGLPEGRVTCAGARQHQRLEGSS
ncbi:Secernin-1 [Plecturocebus cupreus]